MKLGTNDIGSVYLGTNAVQKVYLGTNEVWSSYAYLLDDYSGAAAAYSLRLLRSAYTGSAIRVRRSSDNAEQDIGFVNNELDTATLTSFCSGTNGFVKTWYDQSGNGRDATQTTAANQPQIVSSGSVITDNGTPSIQNNNDELRFAPFASSGGFAIFTVATPLTQESIFVSGGDDVNSRFDFGVRTSTDYRILVTESGTTERINSTSNYFNTFGLYIGTEQSLRLNGGNINTGTINTNIIAYSTSNNALFTRRFSSVDVSYGSSDFKEIIIYATSQSANITGIETNINSFYSIY